MDNKIYKNFINEVKKIKMTRDEKDRVLRAVLENSISQLHSPTYSKNINTKRIKSPFDIYSIRSWIHIHKVVTVSLAIIFIVSFGGGGVVSASNNSLPGDTLYPIKVGVVEPVRVALKSSSVTKAIAQGELVNKRLEEAEILAINDTLDENKLSTIESLINEHSEDFSVEIEKVREKGDDDTADDISVALQGQMNAHAILLSKIENSKNIAGDAPVAMMAMMATGPAESVDSTEDLSDKVDVTVSRSAKVSAVPMVEAVSVDLSTKILEKASSIRIKSEEIDNEEKSDFGIDKEKYEKKKDSVKKYIEYTKNAIEKSNSKSDSISKSESVISVGKNEDEQLEVDSWKNEIIEDSNNSLNEAMEALKSAEENEKKGDKERAYSDLRKSERATGKADTLIKSGFKIEKERGQNSSKKGLNDRID